MVVLVLPVLVLRRSSASPHTSNVHSQVDRFTAWEVVSKFEDRTCLRNRSQRLSIVLLRHLLTLPFCEQRAHEGEYYRLDDP